MFNIFSWGHVWIDNLWPLCIQIDVRSHWIFISIKSKEYIRLYSGAVEKNNIYWLVEELYLQLKKLFELYLKSIWNLFECHDNETNASVESSKIFTSRRMNNLGPLTKSWKLKTKRYLILCLVFGNNRG